VDTEDGGMRVKDLVKNYIIREKEYPR
jgi:hypothetical protein